MSVWASVSVYLGGGGLLLDDNCKFVAAEESQIEMEGHVSQEVSQVRNGTRMSQLKHINVVTYTLVSPGWHVRGNSRKFYIQ